MKQEDKMQQKVTVGRIVHYVMPQGHHRAGEIRPAIIVRVWQQLDHPSVPGMANLQIFLDGANDAAGDCTADWPSTMWKGSVLHSEAPNPGTWHWPPRD